MVGGGAGAIGKTLNSWVEEATWVDYGEKERRYYPRRVVTQIYSSLRVVSGVLFRQRACDNWRDARTKN